MSAAKTILVVDDSRVSRMLTRAFILSKQPDWVVEEACSGEEVLGRVQALSPALRAWVELRLGNVHDLRGERQAAQAWYQGVQGDEQAEARARAYMTTPFMPVQIDLKPLEQAVI